MFQIYADAFLLATRLQSDRRAHSDGRVPGQRSRWQGRGLTVGWRATGSRR